MCSQVMKKLLNKTNKAINKIFCSCIEFIYFTLFNPLKSNIILFYDAFLRFAKSSHYARLMRVDNPIGYVLLILPVWCSVILASRSFWQAMYLCIIFGIGGFIMRSAGCIINDIWDVNIDKNVDRTKNRPLANGDLTKKQAYKALSLLLLVASLILLTLPESVIYTGLFGLFLVVIYPLLKRFTYLAQFFLGLTFNIGVLMAWFTVSPEPSFTPFLLYFSAALWTVGYDTIYAFQDIEDDIKLGLESMAIKISSMQYDVQDILWKIYQLSLVTLCIAGLSKYMNTWFYLIVGFAAYQMYLKINSFDHAIKKDCSKLFLFNGFYGLIIFFAVLVGKR